MKVALVAPSHLPARRANTIQVMKMAQAITALGHEVRVYVPGLPPQPVNWDDLSVHYGLQQRFAVEWLPARPRLRRYDYALYALRRARRWGADLLYTRLPQAAALGSTWGMPTIFEVHDLPGGILGPWLLTRFLAGRGACGLVVISQALRDDLFPRGVPPTAPPVLVAPDGVDLERYADLPTPRQARADLGLPARFTAGYSGHLYAGRGVDIIFALAARLPEMHFLLLGGERDDVARLRERAALEGLANITLTGFIPNAELPRYQAACDVLLMPYQRRVAASSGGDIARYLSPMKLFEYLACGRAILSSDLPVLREVLNEENAILLPPNDVPAWAAALRTLQTDEPRRTALAAQARSDAQRYSWRSRAARILDSVAAHL